MPAVSIVYPIVEGHGEVEAVPVLLRRIAMEFKQYIRVESPYRLPRGSMLQSEEKLDAALRLAAGRLLATGLPSGIVVCHDSNGDAVEDLREQLRPRLARVDDRIKVHHAIAVREYEAWFLAAAESFRNHLRCRPDAEFIANPEEIRGAKEQFQRSILRDGEYYSETVDQSRFTAIFDINLAKRCVSFNSLMTEMAIWFSD
jgi:hypothetical protein